MSRESEQTNRRLLRETHLSVTDICMSVGFTSLGTFSRTFREIMGQTPSEFRAAGTAVAVPTSLTKRWNRPSSFGEAPRSEPE